MIKVDKPRRKEGHEVMAEDLIKYGNDGKYRPFYACLRWNINEKFSSIFYYMSVKANPRYVTDENGHKIDVILSLKEYKALLNYIEELEDVKSYDAAKKNAEYISWEDAKRELKI